MEQQQQVNGMDKLAPAYIKAVKACGNAKKDANNSHLGNDYATLESVLDTVKAAFLANELWLYQSPGRIVNTEGGPVIELVGVLMHSSGQMLQVNTQLPASQFDKKLNANKLTAQTAGSALTYARRYQWAAVAGITQVDDDGEAASTIDTSAPPQGGAAVDAAASPLLEKIKAAVAAKDMDALKAVRDEVQAAKNKGLSDAYLDARKTIKGE